MNHTPATETGTLPARPKAKALGAAATASAHARCLTAVAWGALALLGDRVHADPPPPTTTPPPAAPAKPPLCDEDPPCRGHRDSAMKLYENKQYREALTEFAAAHDLRPEPHLLLNIGRCLFRVGKPRSALLRYEEFKRQVPDPDPDTRATIERYIKEAKATVGTFSDSERDSPPPGTGKSAPSKVSSEALRALAPPAAMMGSGLLCIIASIATGVASANTATDFDVASQRTMMWNPEVAGLYSTGKTLNGVTAGLAVTGIVLSIGGGIWLGTTLQKRRPPPVTPDAAQAP